MLKHQEPQRRSNNRKLELHVHDPSHQRKGLKGLSKMIMSLGTICFDTENNYSIAHIPKTKDSASMNTDTIIVLLNQILCLSRLVCFLLLKAKFVHQMLISTLMSKKTL